MKINILGTMIVMTIASSPTMAKDHELKNPFISEKNKVQDISFTYLHANYMEADKTRSYSIAGSKAFNRFMFGEIEASYNENDNIDGTDFGFALGFNYPLPLSLDLAVADLYIKGGYEKRSYDEYLDTPETSDLTDADIQSITKDYSAQFANGESFFALGGFKSNFGSNDLLVNAYGGIEVAKADNETLQYLIDEGNLEENYLLAGIDIAYMLTKTTSIELKTKYQYEETSIGIGFTMYMF